MKTYKLSNGIEVTMPKLKIKTLYAILNLFKQVKSTLKVDITDTAALENVQYEDIIDAVIQSDLLGSFLNIILCPVNKTDKIDFNDTDIDEAFFEVVQDFFIVNNYLPKIYNLIKSAWGGMKTTLNS